MKNYKDCGVDVELGDKFVEKIKKHVQRTYNNKVMSGVGGFSAIYKLSDEKFLSAGTDGVGTKVKLAQELNIHHTIGIDLVAMCVNDVICSGATPEFFLDYLACDQIDLKVHESIIEGICQGLEASECALIGGETAEMPGVYHKGEYDLAGFCVGSLSPKTWIDGSRVKPGAKIIGLKSSGFHSNGYSLVRHLVKDESIELKKEVLTPTRIYHSLVKSLLSDQRENILGMAHITGGGFENIPRVNETFGYFIEKTPDDSFRPEFMNTIIQKSKLSTQELYQTFNMGVGFVFVVEDEMLFKNKLIDLNEEFIVLGNVTDEFQGLKFF